MFCGDVRQADWSAEWESGRVDLDEKTSWSSPIIVKNEGCAMLIVAETNRVRAYDAPHAVSSGDAAACLRTSSQIRLTMRPIVGCYGQWFRTIAPSSVSLETSPMPVFASVRVTSASGFETNR